MEQNWGVLKTRLDFSTGTDSDGDGLPDEWERWVIEVAGRGSGADGRATDADVAAFRPDGDGMTNLQEFLAGTDPFTVTDLFKIESFDVLPGTGRARLVFTSAADRSYRVVMDETPGEPWTPVATTRTEGAALAHESHKGTGRRITVYVDASLAAPARSDWTRRRPAASSRGCRRHRAFPAIFKNIDEPRKERIITRETRRKERTGRTVLKTGLALASAALVGEAAFAASADEPTATYCVIDLSVGANATIYPVTTLDTVPEGGWTDEYKTTKLVLRRCSAGADPLGYNTGVERADLERAGWYDGNSEARKHPVGEKAPNDWGLYDMHGNVWEWCLDWTGGGLSGEDPVGAAFASYRIRFGGAYNSEMACATASSIMTGNSESRGADLGFRLFWTLSAGPRLSLIGDAGATIAGDARQGFVIAASQNAKAIEVVIPNGVEASNVTVKVPPTVKTVKPNGATIRVVYTRYDMTDDLVFPAEDANGVIDFAAVTVKPDYANPLGASEAVISLSDPSAPSLTVTTRKGLRCTLYEGYTLGTLKPSSHAWTIGHGGTWSPTPSVTGGTSGFYTIRVDFK